MQNQNRKSSTMKSIPPVRIQLTVPGEESPRPSFDIHQVSTLASTVTLSKNKLTTNIHHSLSPNIDGAQRPVRFSSVSSSYAQFLKQRDMDKVKKIVSHMVVICFFVSSINKVSYIFVLLIEL
jgi:hypothetical protein